MYIGIDFGTTYSALSIYTKNETWTGLLPALCGSRGEPTHIRYDSKTKQWLCGKKCEADKYPKDTIRNIKAKIRDGGDIDQNVSVASGYRLSFRELLKRYLCWFIKDVYKKACNANEAVSDEAVEHVVVTVPCGFAGRGMTRSQYGQAIKEGVVAAYKDVIDSGVQMAVGNEVPVTIVEEPVAAAEDYLMSGSGKRALDQKSDLNILVADLGGGTFDATVIKCSGHKKFQVVAKDGDLHLGGNDFDNELLRILIPKLKAANPGYSLSEEERSLELLRVSAIKESLSEFPSLTFSSFKETKCVISREEFERATRGLLQRIQEILKKCVDKTGGIEQIDKIVLVGGGSNMPQILNGIKELFPSFDEQNIIINKPSYAIANGAAYCAAAKGGVTVLPPLEDVATCTYGFRYEKDNKKIRNMIFRGQQFVDGRIERDVPDSFIPMQSDQSMATYTVFESTFEKSAGDIQYKGNEEKFNANGLKVTVPVPVEYIENREKHPDGAREYEMYPKMILTSDGILKLEIYHDGVMIGSNEIKIE